MARATAAAGTRRVVSRRQGTNTATATKLAITETGIEIETVIATGTGNPSASAGIGLALDQGLPADDLALDGHIAAFLELAQKVFIIYRDIVIISELSNDWF